MIEEILSLQSDPAILALSAVVWGVTFLGVGLVSFWLFEVLVLSSRSLKEAEYGPEDVHVRILTVDNGPTVRETIEKLDDSLNDIHVVAEKSIDVEDVALHVVPDGFECEAEKKGRALEWANRNLRTEREFVLYLDEDSHMTDFKGLPDRDVVQLREKPRYTGSLLSYIADVFRMGVQIEQLAFPNLRLPLFAWGGGIAIRRETEKEIGWNRESIVEDTAFVWRAGSRGHSFGVSNIYVRNEAPPGILALLKQRRRWAGGNHSEAKDLAQPYRSLQRIRNFAWGLTPMSAIVVPVLLFLTSQTVIYEDLLQLAGTALFAITPLWYVLGVIYYRELNPLHLPGLLLAYPSAILHGIGAMWGIVSKPGTFDVTPKKNGG